MKRLLLALLLCPTLAGAATPPTFIQQSPVASWTGTGTPIALPAFSVVTGDALVCACVSADVNGPLAIITSSPSLTWNATPGISSPGSHTSTGLWTAIATSSTSITVSCNRTGTAQLMGGNCLTFRNHGGIGTKPAATVSTGAPSHTVTTMGANSALVYVNGDWAAVAGAETWRANAGSATPMTGYPGDGTNYGVHIAYHADSGAVGSKALGLTLPTAQTYNAMAVEILGIGDIPLYRSSGAFTNNAAAATCPMPTGVNAQMTNDVLLLVVETENQTAGLGTANGFAAVTNSPQGAGTAAVNPANAIAVFWKRAVGGDAAPITTDSGDHQTCQIHVFTGVKNSGDPWNITAGGNDSAANDTTANIPGATTSVANTLVALVQGTSVDSTTTANCGAVTNANLATITERADNNNLINLGGGHCLITGTKAAAGTYATSTLTMAATTFKGAMSIALEPVAAAGGAPACTNFMALMGAGCK